MHYLDTDCDVNTSTGPADPGSGKVAKRERDQGAKGANHYMHTVGGLSGKELL